MILPQQGALLSIFENGEQIPMPGIGWISFEHRIDSTAAEIKFEVAQMVKAAMEFINRSTGQKLAHLRQENSDVERELRLRGGSRA